MLSYPTAGRFISPDTLVPDPNHPLDYNRYLYARGNPLKYNDPTGHWIESALDVAFIGYDLYDIRQNGLTWGNGLALAADIGGLLLPMVTGGGALVRIVSHGDDAADALKFASNADQLSELVRRVDQGVPAAKAVTDVSPAVLDTIQRYDIKPYSEFSRPRVPKGTPVHHLVEKRFFDQLGFATKDEAVTSILSTYVDSAHHTEITQAIRRQIPIGEGTLSASPQQVWNVHKQVYNQYGHDDWAEVIWEVYFQHLPDVTK